MNSSLVFFYGLLRNPRRVGAVFPASQRLTRAILTEACRSPTDVLIEVGAGTGVITEELVAEQNRFKHVVVVERDALFSQRLSQLFPSLDVRQGCASNINSYLPRQYGSVTIISSLPLLSMPKAEVAKCIAVFEEIISRHPESKLIQYTYSTSSKAPWDAKSSKMAWRHTKKIWLNLPPAKIWLLTHRAS